MKYTLDNLKFPVVAIGIQVIDGEVNFENHTVLFKSRESFNSFLGETEQIVSDMYGEYLKKEEKSYKIVYKRQKSWERYGDENSWRREYDLYEGNFDMLFLIHLRILVIFLVF